MDFNPQLGHEQGGFRPGLVISTDLFNTAPNGLHIVVPITTRDRGIRLHLPILPPEGGLKRPSVLMCDQARVQSVLRFHNKRGKVSDDVLQRVQAVVEVIIGLD